MDEKIEILNRLSRDFEDRENEIGLARARNDNTEYEKLCAEAKSAKEIRIAYFESLTSTKH